MGTTTILEGGSNTNGAPTPLSGLFIFALSLHCLPVDFGSARIRALVLFV